MPRRLLYVPIVHGEADLGALAGRARAAAERALGAGAWASRQAAIAEFWSRVQAWADAREDWAGVRVYQDGLPVCGRETAIVEDLAARGSPNHRLLLSLLARDAVLVGTESPELLTRELELTRALLERPAGVGPDPRHADRARALLERRDRFIADRIAATLPEGGVGVLFLGAAHHAKAMIDRSIEVEDCAPHLGPVPAAR